jgi:hypothetical protein
MIREATSFLLDVLKNDLPEQANWQNCPNPEPETLAPSLSTLNPQL